MEESESASTLNSSDATCNFCGMVDLEKAYDNVILLNLISIGFILAVPVLCYAVFIKCTYPTKFAIVKWHAFIFIVNFSFWFLLIATVAAGVCNLPISHNFYIVSLPFLFVLAVLVVVDMFLSPEGKYFRQNQRVYSTAEYLEMVRAALPSIKVNVRSLYREPMYNNQKINRPSRKLVVTAHRYFPIDSFSDESTLPSMANGEENDGSVTTFHIKKIVEAGDDYSHKQFIAFKTKFISSCQRNRGGQFINDTVEMDIPGLEERVVTVSNNEAVLPWWASRKIYYILSLLSASILLRVLFQMRSKRHNVVVLKKYFLYPLNKGGIDEVETMLNHGGYEEYQPFLAEEDCPPPYNPTIEWK